VGTIDPNYQKAQQQYFYNLGLERAKKAQREHKTSRGKTGVILAIVFLAAVAVVFVLSGGLDFLGYHHVRVDGISYRIGGKVVVSRDEGFSQAGTLHYTEDWKHGEENFSTNLDYETAVYVNPEDRSKVYLRWMDHYLICPRERVFFLK